MREQTQKYTQAYRPTAIQLHTGLQMHVNTFTNKHRHNLINTHKRKTTEYNTNTGF